LGCICKDAEGIKTFMMFYKVGYEDVLLVVSAMGKTTNALEVVIKITSTSLQHCNPQFK
jgi:aspartate kinase